MNRSVFSIKCRLPFLAILAVTALLLVSASAVSAESTGTKDTSVPGQITLTNYVSDECLYLTGNTKLILNGDNSILIKDDYELESIIGDYDLTITGSGSLTVNRVINCRKLTIEGTTVNSDTGAMELPCFYAPVITISNAKVKLASLKYVWACIGLDGFDSSDGTSIKIINGSEVAIDTGGVGIQETSVVIEDSTLTISCSSSSVVQPTFMRTWVTGIRAHELSIARSTVAIEGPDVCIASTKASIDHSNVSLASQKKDSEDPAALSVAIAAGDTFEIKDGVIKTPEAGTIGEAAVPTEWQSYYGMTTVRTVLDKDGKVAEKVVIDEHKWDTGKVTKEATEAAEGEKTYTCTVCGETKTEAIPKLTPAPVDPAKQMGEDGTAFGKGASAEAAEAAILGLKNDNDPAGTVFNSLQFKAAKTTKSSIKLTWKKIKGAKKYVLYANKCGKKNKYKKLKALSKNSLTVKKVAGAKLKKGTHYKFLLVALDKNNNVLTVSTTVHAATAGGKITNPKKVTTKTKKNKVTIKAKKTFKLGAVAVKASKKLKMPTHRAMKYETSNAKVATVSKKGVIKGVKKGTCYVYAYAQNGVCAKVKVTVK